MPGSLFISFSMCRLAEIKIAKSSTNFLCIYFLIVCRLVFLFSSLCAVWQKTRSQNRQDSKLIFFVFPHCVPASLFIFFTLCRLAENKIAKSSKIIFFVFPHCVPGWSFYFLHFVPFGRKQDRKIAGLQINFLCISSLCAG